MNKKYYLILLQFALPLLYGALYYFVGSGITAQLLTTAIFVAGLYIGVGLLWLDQRWLHQYYAPEPAENQSAGQEELSELESPELESTTEPEKPESAKVKKLITRSILFVVSLAPLSIYMITSTGSPMGVGVLLGIMLGLLAEMIVLGSNKQVFHKRYLFQLKRTATKQEINWYIRIFALFTLLITILVMR